MTEDANHRSWTGKVQHRMYGRSVGEPVVYVRLLGVESAIEIPSLGRTANRVLAAGAIFKSVHLDVVLSRAFEVRGASELRRQVIG